MESDIYFNENCSTKDKAETLKALQILSNSKKLGIWKEPEQCIEVDSALAWIKDVNDLKRFRKFRGNFDNSDLDTTKIMLELINQLEISKETSQKKIRELNYYFSSCRESASINQKNEITIRKLDFTDDGVHINESKIFRNGQAIDVLIKTYKDADPNMYRNKFEKETKILRRTSEMNPCFLKYYGSLFDTINENETTKYCYDIIVEYCPWRLSDLIRDKKTKDTRFSDEELKKYCFDLLEAFEILEKLNFYHQDIKPDNIYVTKDGHLKIFNYNVSDTKEIIERNSLQIEFSEAIIKTQRYIAPELKIACIEKDEYIHGKNDVFSLGLLLYKIATFQSIKDFNKKSYVRDRVLEDVEFPWLKNIIYDMLNFEYKDRPSFAKIFTKLKRIFEEVEEIKISESNRISLPLPSWVVENSDQDDLITRRNQIIMDRAIFVQDELNINICKIVWKGNEINAIIKTYKELGSCISNKKFVEEVAILKNLSGKHPLFLEFYGDFYDEIIENDIKICCWNVVIEYCPYNFADEIKSRINSNKKFTPDELKAITISLLEAYAYMAANSIYHQNIKPSNILMTKDKKLKITNFRKLNVKEIIEETDSTNWVWAAAKNPYYLAPELKWAYLYDNLEFEYFPEKADVYSLGLVLYQCATLKYINKKPLSDINDVELPWLRDLLFDMLCNENTERISFIEALNRAL